MIERWNWFRHFVKEAPQTLLKAKYGVAVVERRTKANLQNVGVAASRDRFIKEAIELEFCRITTGWSWRLPCGNA
jgi:hypothetical protein